MYDIYEKEISSAFVGPGVETLIVKGGIVLSHTRGWDDSFFVDDDFTGPLQGQSFKGGKGWRKLRGFALENAQAWADDVVR